MNTPCSDHLLDLDRLEALASCGEVDTVICAVPDPYGRLMGKRLTPNAFRNLCLKGDGVHAAGYLFAADPEMTPVDLPLSNADNGYPDIRLVPDYATLRRVPWEPNTVMVLCDGFASDSDDLIAVAPRSILKHQIQLAAEQGLAFKFASELEFFVATVPPQQAWNLGYRNLPMTSNYRADYQLLQSARDDGLIGRIRNEMPRFAIPIESSKTEWGLGQQEVTIDYADALDMADYHVLFKHGVKQLAHQLDYTATFMAKPGIDEVGSSCHLHVSMWSAVDHRPLCWSQGGSGGMSADFGSFVAGQLESAGQMSLLFAPTINSYKRFQPDQFAGTALALGEDNRSCAFRLVGQRDSFRVENRIPGADVNPYYAYAATIAAGLDGIRRGLSTPEIFRGNAYQCPSLELIPTTMHEAIRRFRGSAMLKSALGSDVFDHLAAFASNELDAFESGTVTDWELQRYYERV